MQPSTTGRLQPGLGHGLAAYLAELVNGMCRAIERDRLWFRSNPHATVRFRSASEGEFTPLYTIGATPPVFRPSFCKVNAPLNWVAVIDLIRLVGSATPQAVEATARLRLQIPAIRSKKMQQIAKAELVEAIAAELLEIFQTEQSNNVA